MTRYYPKYKPAKKVPAQKFVKKVLRSKYMMRPERYPRPEPDYDTVRTLVEDLQNNLRGLQVAKTVVEDAIGAAEETLTELEYELGE